MNSHDEYLDNAAQLAVRLARRYGEYVDGTQVSPTDHDAIDGAMYIWELSEEIKRLTSVKVRARLLIQWLERSINAGPLSRFPIPEREFLVALRDAVAASEDFTIHQTPPPWHAK